ncbi:MAG: DUF4230 domain-containing protein, partial [Allobaculum sp.]|nr:DUF4230 domain-containing protein [Allobaculum sp.]
MIGFVIGAILILLASFGGCFAFSQAEEKTKITSTQLKSSLEQASDLITTKYYYSQIGKFENSYELNGWSIPFTEKNFILTYQGEAQLGFKTSDLEVNVNGNKISVKCPPIEILSNSIPSESVEVYDQSYNIFNQVSVDDYLQFETEQKALAVERMQTTGVFEQAQKDARTAIIQLLNMVPEIQEAYAIDVEFSAQSSLVDSTQDSINSESQEST